MTVDFRSGWCAAGLGDYRPCEGTYEIYPYESLPDLDEARFTGEFRWFGDLGVVVPDGTRALPGLGRSLGRVGLALPPDFVTFWSSQGSTTGSGARFEAAPAPVSLSSRTCGATWRITANSERGSSADSPKHLQACHFSKNQAKGW